MIGAELCGCLVRFVREGSEFTKDLALGSVQMAGLVHSSPLPEISANLAPPRPAPWTRPDGKLAQVRQLNQGRLRNVRRTDTGLGTGVSPIGITGGGGGQCRMEISTAGPGRSAVEGSLEKCWPMGPNRGWYVCGCGW